MTRVENEPGRSQNKVPDQRIEQDQRHLAPDGLGIRPGMSDVRLRIPNHDEQRYSRKIIRIENVSLVEMNTLVSEASK